MVKMTALDAFEDVLYRKVDHVAYVTINRPHCLNALRTKTYEELCAAVRDATDDASVGVVVIAGAGDKAFSSGGDVKAQRIQTQAGARRHLQRILALGQALRNCDKPTVAVVRGYCLGGGHELHLMCDMTLSGESGKFGQVGPNVGMVPVWGATQILPRVVGEKRARELIYTCRMLSAAEAFEWGLVNQVVPDAELDDLVDATCKKLLDMSPQSLRIAKLSLNHAVDAMWPSFVDGMEMLSFLYGTPEQREGAAAFSEKRKPNFNKFRAADADS
ncbi:MAG: enoyl-CoA hydratase-related protein [Rhizobiaceae bacterium]|nr:enoyl-CoA hydratase-related protein [Rhizobiaceae bacterium]